MKRRNFLQILAGGLILPVELFRGRSQVAVAKVWAPVTLATIANHQTDSFLIGTETWDPYEVEELENGKFLHRVRRREVKVAGQFVPKRRTDCPEEINCVVDRTTPFQVDPAKGQEEIICRIRRSCGRVLHDRMAIDA